LPSNLSSKKGNNIVHEPARQQQNYKNIRKVLANGSLGDSGGAPVDPFDEEDVGRRFELLKNKMNQGGGEGAEGSSGALAL